MTARPTAQQGGRRQRGMTLSLVARFGCLLPSVMIAIVRHRWNCGYGVSRGAE